MTERSGTSGSREPRGARVTRGVVFVHSCPRAVATHVEWALADILGSRVDLDWSAQPVQAGTVRADISWTGPVGTAARIASVLQGWRKLRFEVTEEPTATSEGERYSGTPVLGVHRSAIGPTGDVMLSENRVRAAIARALEIGEPVQDEIEILLGGPWDTELEPFRTAGEGTPVRWLHQVV
ncbi:DUF3145 domain-containing protein [Longivirga aurantiaca]|uniref:DUF3145 domain-containing protein n=1 Tax=Longivirga aurantiaca TaxID=1837743 RepID=A0ABW1T3T4_9ACTN